MHWLGSLGKLAVKISVINDMMRKMVNCRGGKGEVSDVGKNI
jgi:hypothetical protein